MRKKSHTHTQKIREWLRKTSNIDLWPTPTPTHTHKHTFHIPCCDVVGTILLIENMLSLPLLFWNSTKNLQAYFQFVTLSYLWWRQNSWFAFFFFFGFIKFVASFNTFLVVFWFAHGELSNVFSWFPSNYLMYKLKKLSSKNILLLFIPMPYFHIKH